jgi:hypothetical protein
MIRLRFVWPVLAVVLAGFALVAVFANLQGVLRVVPFFAFLFFGPGLALVPLLERDDAATFAALTMGVSLALDTIAATALLYAGRFQPLQIVLTLAILTLIGSATQVYDVLRRLRIVIVPAP